MSIFTPEIGYKNSAAPLRHELSRARGTAPRFEASSGNLTEVFSQENPRDDPQGSSLRVEQDDIRGNSEDSHDSRTRSQSRRDHYSVVEVGRLRRVRFTSGCTSSCRGL